MKIGKKFLSLLIALCVTLTLLPIPVALAEDGTVVPAVMPGSMRFPGATSLSANFNTEYSLSGSSADKMVSVATAQLGRTKVTMGYTDSWCARFVSDVASIAGESVAIPYNAGCRQMYNAIISAGGTDVSTPQKGDIVFFVCTKCTASGYNNAYSHVGIMLDSGGTCISGNYTTNGVAQVAKHSVNSYAYEPHSVASGDILLKYVRPNYMNSFTSAITPEITLSQSSVSMQVGGRATVTIGTKSPGTIYLKAYTNNSSVCGGSWGSWNSAGTERPLTFIGKVEGSATVTIRMYDAKTNRELTSKTISVKVIPAPAPTSDPEISVETLQTLNRAGTASLYPTVFKGYLRGTAKYDAYSDSSGINYIGRIYASDEIKVQSVYINNGVLWMSALCPWDGYASDRLIYAKLDAVVDTGFVPYNAVAASSATVYRRSDASTKYGSLGVGDAITVVGQSGAYSQVIYPLAAGGYKIGWCATSCLSRPNISSVKATSSTSAYFSYTLLSNATNSLVIMDANMNVLTRGVIRNSGVSVSKMKPGVTYYVYVESVLSNGTGTITSPVKKITLK